jgi:UDP-glucose 4-epimerase
MRRVLVTGGAGFIGSHLADALVASGDTVAVLDDLSTGRRDQVPADAELIQGDLLHQGDLASALDRWRPDVIFHLAAQVKVSASVVDPAADAAVNVLGTVQLAQMSLRHKSRIVLASTGGAISGDADEVPTPECAARQPVAPYGAAKLAAEEYLRVFNRLHGTSHAALRLANVYGPRQDAQGEAAVVAVFCREAAEGARSVPVFGDGKQTRDFVFVGDAVQAFLALADHPELTGEWNIGTGLGVSVLDLVDALGDAVGGLVRPRFLPGRPGEVLHSALDPTAAEDAFGWRATMPLTQGLRAVLSLQESVSAP